MISIRSLLDNIDTELVEETSLYSMEDLEKTAYVLEQLSLPDEEVDKMAKIAVLMDMGLEQEDIEKISNFFDVRDSKEVKDAFNSAIEGHKRSTKAQLAAEMIAANIKRDREAEKTIANAMKGPSKLKGIHILGGLLASGALYGAYNYGKESKQAELKNVARKYYDLGQQSQGGN